MIKINIAAVGFIKENYFKEALAEYLKRISRFAEISVLEVPESPKGKDAEGRSLLEKSKGCMILLDREGKLVSSEELAEIIEKRASSGISEITFMIGGPEGVSDEVKKASDLTVSFGRITYPHRLIRVILAEQIYRALAIINKTPYHK